MPKKLTNGRPQCTGSPKKPKSRSPLMVVFIAAVSILMVAGTANAQTESQRIAELERKLTNALTVIDKLSDKIERLETVRTVENPKPSPTGLESAATRPGVATAKPAKDDLSKVVAAQNSRIDTMQQQINQQSSAAANRIIPFDWLHGFADAGGGYNSSGHPSGFGVGSLDLYMTPRLGGQVRALAELVFEYDGIGDLETDLERAQLGYAFSDLATVWLGRFHTPFGYWQTAYHHGQQIQPSLMRPRFIDFEDKGGILPTHTVGIWATGKLQTEGGRFNYDAYVGNSPKIKPNDTLGNGNLGSLDPNVAGFSNPNLTVGGKVGYAFTNGPLDSLSVGIHGLHSEVEIFNTVNANPLAPATGKVDLNMAGGYLYYNNYNWEIISEIYGFFNKDRSSGTGSHNSWAGFIHAGYAIGQWLPYVRLENVDTDSNDPYFNALALGYGYAREAAGLRYDVNPQSALKLELNYTQPQFTPIFPVNNFWESRVQYAIRF